ncbi:hypothetical protein BD410DRAFT_799212 [Rickenella mellea]|uniref:Uncharacterized protein n=1 Tax=Rickenella mellea TaxID=50990 RepID=A0A4Y7QLU4_9AGAM|nr:hypothetical protein BD410DRAFT_799212 [Rickenella mellea]
MPTWSEQLHVERERELVCLRFHWGDWERVGKTTTGDVDRLDRLRVEGAPSQPEARNGLRVLPVLVSLMMELAVLDVLDVLNRLSGRESTGLSSSSRDVLEEEEVVLVGDRRVSRLASPCASSSLQTTMSSKTLAPSPADDPCPRIPPPPKAAAENPPSCAISSILHSTRRTPTYTVSSHGSGNADGRSETGGEDREDNLEECGGAVDGAVMMRCLGGGWGGLALDEKIVKESESVGLSGGEGGWRGWVGVGCETDIWRWGERRRRILSSMP